MCCTPNIVELYKNEQQLHEYYADHLTSSHAVMMSATHTVHRSSATCAESLHSTHPLASALPLKGFQGQSN